MISINDKINAIIYSYHKYKIAAHVFDEAYKFYNKEWKELQKLKDYKLNLLKSVLREAVENGFVKKDIDINIVVLIMESTVNSLFDYETLSKQSMTIQEATAKAMKIILHGILVHT